MNKNIAIAIGVLVLGIIVAMLLSGGTPDSGMPPGGDESAEEANAAPGYAVFSRLDGTWPGTWHNTTFNSEGDVTLSVDVLTDGTATLMMDIGGFVFGLLDPEPMTLEGTYTENEMTFIGMNDVFGDFTARVDADGTVALDAANVTSPGIKSLYVQGMINSETEALEGTYVVTFETGTTANGTIGF